MSLAQTGQALRVSRRTVYYLIKSGRLQTMRTPLGLAARAARVGQDVLGVAG